MTQAAQLVSTVTVPMATTGIDVPIVPDPPSTLLIDVSIVTQQREAKHAAAADALLSSAEEEARRIRERAGRDAEEITAHAEARKAEAEAIRSGVDETVRAEADELLAAARREAEEHLQRAHEEAQNRLEEAWQQAEQMSTAARAEAESAVADARSEVERLRSEAEELLEQARFDRDAVAEDLKEARTAREEAVAAAERILTEAAAGAEDLLETAREDARREAEWILEEARNKAERLSSDTEARIADLEELHAIEVATFRTNEEGLRDRLNALEVENSRLLRSGPRHASPWALPEQKDAEEVPTEPEQADLDHEEPLEEILPHADEEDLPDGTPTGPKAIPTLVEPLRPSAFRTVDPKDRKRGLRRRA